MPDPNRPGSARGPSDASGGVDVRREALSELQRPEPDRSLSGRFPSLPSFASLPSWMVSAIVVVTVVVGLGAWVVVRRPTGAVAALPHATTTSGSSSTRTAARPDTGARPDTAARAGAPDRSDAPAPPDTAGRTGTTVTVHVAGAVNRPGVVSLPVGSRAVDAVGAAGGLAAGADPDRLNLAAPVLDGTRLVVPLLGQQVPPELAPQVPATGEPGSTGGAAAIAAPVDLNSATAQQLDALPGIGPSTAAAIVAYRSQHGSFRSVEGLLDVRGIGDAKLDALRGLVTVGGT